MTYGEQFDNSYLQLRDKDGSREAKLALILPLLELTLFTFYQHQTSSQFSQINIMQLSHNYNKHFKNVFEQNSLEYDFQSGQNQLVKHRTRSARFLLSCTCRVPTKTLSL